MKSLDEKSQVLGCSPFLIIFVIIQYEYWIKKWMYKIVM